MAIVYRVAKGSPLTNAEVDANFLHLDTIKANKEITVTGTNGLTGGGNLSANRTLALGTPSTLTTTSTNSVSPTSHTHALNLSGRSVIAGNGLTGGGDLGSDRTVTLGTPSTLTTTSTNSASGQSHTHQLNLSGREIIAGNGLTGGGDLGSDRTLALGTPSTLTTTSTNSATSTTHNHALNLSGRVITSGSYLTGGGNLGSNLTLNVSATTTASANVVAARDNAADIHARLFRPNYTNEAGISGAIAFRVNNSDNNYIRFCNNVANIRNYLQVPWWGTQIVAGVGLYGGGNLTGSRTLTINTSILSAGHFAIVRSRNANSHLLAGSNVAGSTLSYGGVIVGNAYGVSTCEGAAIANQSRSGTYRVLGTAYAASGKYSQTLAFRIS